MKKEKQLYKEKVSNIILEKKQLPNKAFAKLSLIVDGKEYIFDTNNNIYSFINNGENLINVELYPEIFDLEKVIARHKNIQNKIFYTNKGTIGILKNEILLTKLNLIYSFFKLSEGEKMYFFMQIDKEIFFILENKENEEFLTYINLETYSIEKKKKIKTKDYTLVTANKSIFLLDNKTLTTEKIFEIK